MTNSKVTGIKETREGIRPLGTLATLIKNAVKKKFGDALNNLLTLVGQVPDAKEGIEIAWNEEIPDLDFDEAKVIADEVTVMSEGNANYGKAAGGLLLTVSGFSAEIKRLKGERDALQARVVELEKKLPSQLKGK